MIARVLLMLALCAPALASAQAPNRYAFTLTAPERFELGATMVERYGEAGPPVILIPGMASGPWAWQGMIKRLVNKHRVYVLTLPGFDGRAAVAGAGLTAAQDSLRALITSRKLERPVLIGHSIGGTLALALAAHDPQLVRAVVSLDGLPVLAGTEELSQVQRTQMAAAMGQRRVPTRAQFALEQQDYMSGTGVMDIARADELAKLSANSDPVAVARYMADAMRLDLRPALAAISAPVLLLAPYCQLDADQQTMTQASKLAYYTALMDGTPKLTVTAVPQARHFAMFDQARLVEDTIARFVQLTP